MEASVFTYFLAIGAGLTTGVAMIFFPSMWLFNRMNRKGGKKNVW